MCKNFVLAVGTWVLLIKSSKIYMARKKQIIQKNERKNLLFLRALETIFTPLSSRFLRMSQLIVLCLEIRGISEM